MPKTNLIKTARMSISEQEQLDKVVKEVNQKFSKIKEFQESNQTPPDNIKILGVGSTAIEDLITDFEASIYIYPTGEKDGGIIILGSDEEVVSITFSPFTTELKNSFKKLDPGDEDDLIDRQMSMASELFDEWYKSND